MAGEAKRTQTAYISAPVDGLDLISPPNQMSPTSARQLDNYYTLDWGVRQRAGGVEQKNFSVPFPTGIKTLIPFIRMDGANAGNEAMLCTAEKKIFRFNSKTDTAPTDLSGGFIYNNSFTHHVIFNDFIFLFSGTDGPVKYQISDGGNVVTTGLTGPADMTKLYQPTTFKNRLYVAERLSTTFWYAGVGAIAGPMASFDVAQVFQQGGYIATLTSWSFNQGIGSEEFLVIISNLGEVLIYSGDYPAATNWQLAGRTNIPRPVGTRSFIRVAQDVYLYTMRGVVALSRVFSGNTDDRYYIVSNKLGPQMHGTDVIPAYNSEYPFLYFTGEDGSVLFVLNYERGGWSRFRYNRTILPTGLQRISAVAVSFGSLFIGVLGGLESKLYRFDDFQAGAVSGPDYLIWKTPFLGFDNGFVKSSKYVRVVARDMGTAPITNTVSVATEFQNTDTDSAGTPYPGSVLHPSADTQTTPNPNSHPDIECVWVSQELRPPGNGKTLSYVFSKTGDGDMGEITGCEVMVETGGAYG